MTITHIGQDHWVERGKRIERARNWVHCSQDDLAERMSILLARPISRQVVYNLEKGERDWRGDERVAIAYLLDQDENWLDARPHATFNDAARLNEAMGVYLSSLLVAA